MKRKGYIWLFTIMATISFISCGGGSKEAKELLKKILEIIGIPQEAVTNICQTNNSSDICEGVRLNKVENSKEKIWQKITETGEGQYLLETDKPCKPILLELKDSDVHYDNGEFFLKFSGVEYGETTKELSILEAMVDATYLSSSSVIRVKELNSSEAQNSFYSVLYRDLKKNINILRETGLNQTQSIRGTLKEMAEELLSYGVSYQLPNTLNSCNGDSTCIQNELDKLSQQLLIDSNESTLIYNAEKDNSSPLSVREVSCEEPQKSEKRLTKWIGYDENGTEYLKGVYSYDEYGRVKEINYQDTLFNGNWQYKYKYSKDKIEVSGFDTYADHTYNWSWEILLENNIFKEKNFYNENGELYWKYRVLEYDNKNRPIKIEKISYLENRLNYIYIYEYDGDYLVHFERIDQDIEYYNTTELYDYQYNRDYRCISWNEIVGELFYGWDYDGEICINWTSLTVTEKQDKSSYTERQEITYDKSGLPIRIDYYDKDNKHTYEIFEYGDI